MSEKKSGEHLEWSSVWRAEGPGPTSGFYFGTVGHYRRETAQIHVL